MKPNPFALGCHIVTAAQHRAAERHIEKLIDLNPSPRSKTGRELKWLATQIETYERKKYPQWFSLPAPLPIPEYLHHIINAHSSAMLMEGAIVDNDKRERAAPYKRTLDHLEKAIDRLARPRTKPKKSVQRSPFHGCAGDALDNDAY